MRQRLFGTRGRLVTTALAATVLSTGLGIGVCGWIRTSSTDVGTNLILIVVWITVMMGASGFQAMLAGDLLWGERWRRRTLLGWEPSIDELDPEDVKDRSWLLYVLMAALLSLNYTGNGALNGNFFGWYQFRGFDLVRLRSEDPEQRLEAVLELADHEDPAVIGALVPKIHDPDPAVRAEAIGVMGDKGVQAARPDLFRALEGAGEGPRAAAAEALGKLRGAGVVQALTGVLSRERSPGIRRGVLAGLGLLGDEIAGDLVAGIARDAAEDDAVRASAVWALARLRSGTARESLGAALAGGGPISTRCAALHALAKLENGKAEGPPPAIVAAFNEGRGGVGDACDRLFVSVRAKARCFGKLNRPSDVPYEGPCLDLQLSSPEKFRIKALRAAAKAAGKTAMPWLAEVNNDGDEPAAIRSWAAELYLKLKAL